MRIAAILTVATMASGLALYADEATTQAPQKDPIYKVWKLPKRLVHRSSKPETRTVEAPATAESAKPANEWWGDQYWKTNRNAQQWPTSVAAAPKE